MATRLVPYQLDLITQLPQLPWPRLFTLSSRIGARSKFRHNFRNHPHAIGSVLKNVSGCEECQPAFCRGAAAENLEKQQVKGSLLGGGAGKPTRPPDE